MILPAWKREAD